MAAIILRNLPKIMLSILLLWLFTNLGCAKTISTAPLPTAPTEMKTLQAEFSPTAVFVETESLKRIVDSPTPLVTNTTTPAPAGIFVSYFYSPLTMNYDPSIWEIKNVLQSKELASCYIAEQGPTDFNGPHTSEVVQLGDVKYEILSFPELSATGLVSKAYIADQSLATKSGLPVFWVSAKPDEWNKCRPLAEKVLSTLHFPS